MNYTALIENRKSVRGFRKNTVSQAVIAQLREYYEKSCHRLVPEIGTRLLVLGTEARDALEGSAGYEDFLVGAPQYLVLLSEKHPHMGENAGFMMEDLILKLGDLDCDSCWLTFTDSDRVKEALKLDSPMEVAAIAAFGYGVKTAKKMRLNIFSMSNVDVQAQRSYYSQKKDINEMVFVDRLDNIQGLDARIGFYDDMLWQAFYAASKAPSYLNRQPYAFLIREHQLMLVRLPDAYTDDASAALGLGIVMLHFTAVAEQWVGRLQWKMDPAAPEGLPGDCIAAAVCNV